MVFKELPKFNEEMDNVLLNNGFAYYNDWEYGPIDGWSEDGDHISLKLFRHDFGYLIQFKRHVEGENQVMIIGESNNALDIIALRNALKKCRLSRIDNR